MDELIRKCTHSTNAQKCTDISEIICSACTVCIPVFMQEKKHGRNVVFITNSAGDAFVVSHMIDRYGNKFALTVIMHRLFINFLYTVVISFTPHK
jgi:hypothetical protein